MIALALMTPLLALGLMHLLHKVELWTLHGEPGLKARRP